MSAMPMEARLAHLEGTVGQIGDRLNGFDARFTNIERNIDVTNERIDATNERIDATNERIQALDHRLYARIDALISHMDARFDTVERRSDLMDRRFSWLMGLVVASMLLPVIEHFTLR